MGKLVIARRSRVKAVGSCPCFSVTRANAPETQSFIRRNGDHRRHGMLRPCSHEVRRLWDLQEESRQITSGLKLSVLNGVIPWGGCSVKVECKHWILAPSCELQLRVPTDAPTDDDEGGLYWLTQQSQYNWPHWQSACVWNDAILRQWSSLVAITEQYQLQWYLLTETYIERISKLPKHPRQNLLSIVHITMYYIWMVLGKMRRFEMTGVHSVV